MAKTVTCLFNSEAQASSIVTKLEDTGLSRGKICMFTNSGNNRFWDDATGIDESAGGSDHDRVERYLAKNGVPGDDARAYAEGVRRGHTLVAVRCDDDEVDWVVDILDDDDVLDLDERQDSWRSDGWSDRDSGVAGMSSGSAAATPNTSAGLMDDAGLASNAGFASTTGTDGRMGGQDRLASEDRMTSDDSTAFNDSLRSDRTQLRDTDMDRGDEVIPVAEEELHVGKREVSHGRVRIRSHVIERPVEEQVSLREERVQVERRPVEGSMHAGTIGGDNLFQERTLEVEERGEEAVVSKEARVVEEVVVRKEADQRTQTVSDTVRKTEVEVEDERGNTVSRTGTTDDKR
jgi:uncharacterized protein (TIGR02271 family)